MKKVIYSAVAFAMMSVAANAQSQRLVLAEEFSNASCGPCAAQNPAFNTLLSANTTKVVSVKYQTNWPGVDPMNAQTQSEVGPRVTYYGVNGVPHANMDGVPQTGSSYTGAPANWTQALINTQYAVASPFTVGVTHTLSNDLDSIFITCTITASQNFTSNGTLKGHVVLVEHQIDFTSAPGTNGETVFHSVMRKMYPNSSGTTLPGSWNNGDVQTITVAAALPSYIYNKGEIAVVAFVQSDGDKIVQQSGYSQPQPLAIDASASVLSGLPIYQCSASVTPSVTVKNLGSTTMTSCTINYQVDANPAQTQAWTGSLATGQTAVATLPALTPGSGTHTLTVWTSNPNGNTDYNTVNDQQVGTFAILPSVGSAPLVEGYTSTTFPPANWFMDNADNDAPTWTRKTGAGGFGNSTACAKMDFFAAAAGTEDFLYAPVTDMTAAGSTNLTFSVAYCQYQAENDQLDIEVSTNCGSTWSNVYSKSGSTLSTKPAQTTAFTPTASQWRAETVSLASYASANNLLIRFHATSAYGNNLYIDDINIGTVGITEAGLSDAVSVYPNPANDVINVSFGLSNTSAVKLAVYNTLGELVLAQNFDGMSTGSHNVKLDVSNLNSGVYFVAVQTGENTVSKKITVTK